MTATATVTQTRTKTQPSNERWSMLLHILEGVPLFAIFYRDLKNIDDAILDWLELEPGGAHEKINVNMKQIDKTPFLWESVTTFEKIYDCLDGTYEIGHYHYGLIVEKYNDEHVEVIKENFKILTGDPGYLGNTENFSIKENLNDLFNWLGITINEHFQPKVTPQYQPFFKQAQ